MPTEGPWTRGRKVYIRMEVVGKGERYLRTPSPLSQWGQFPIFTGVSVSDTGRPRRYSPLSGEIGILPMQRSRVLRRPAVPFSSDTYNVA